MYVHVGEDILVRTSEIVAIIDKKIVKSSQSVKDFLNFHEENIIHLTNGSFKSIVITERKIYFSPLASETLKKRSTERSMQEFG